MVVILSLLAFNLADVGHFLFSSQKAMYIGDRVDKLLMLASSRDGTGEEQQL